MFLLLLNCVIFCLNIFSISSASQPQPAFHLIQFHDSLPEASQLHLLWNQTSSVSAHCHWPGVSCYSNNDFRVRSLNLTGLGLSGVLDNPIANLCKLQDLTSLDLSGNNFTGTIPVLLRNCSQLSTILLNDNGLSGEIPPEIFKSRRLEKLDLGYNRISGTIPVEVGQCNSLQYIGLYNNLLSGEIPNELFFPPNLKFLYLYKNNLTGVVPDLPSSCLLSELLIQENSFHGPLPLSLSNCNNLRTLDASYDNFGGVIPENIFKGMKELEILYLTGNNFEGEIPKSLWGLGNLQEVSLLENRFNGSIPDEISKCYNLTYLNLSVNNLTGQIPSSIFSLKKLENLYLYENMLNGIIPPEIGKCTSLAELRVQQNQIKGIIPREICELERITFLHVFENQIEGPIPHCIERLISLEELLLYNNRLTGKIPSGISKLTKITFLSLAHNNLTGTVPSDIGTSLVRLDLTGNYLTGEIPSGVCSGNSLSVLTLGDNRFTGSFPIEITKCMSLKRLILRNNLLQGSIPEDIEKSSSISYFDISRNFFEGKVPKAFSFWSNLSMIDFSENKFSGSIPRELGRLQNLEELRISSNRLTGEIPTELTRCPKITELDLSKNNLSGRIPSEIISSLTLTIIRLNENKLAGVIPNSFSSSQNLHELQLGNNMLEGPFPCSMGEVHHFSSVLNLSMNRFSGQLPRCIGNLDKLEVLDISSNNFFGEIPLRVNSMQALTFVNISFNQFSGQIPSFWAKLFGLHSGLTLGNPKLCTNDNKSSTCETRREKSHRRNLILAGIITVSSLVIACLLASAYVLVIRRTSPHQAMIYHRTSEDLPEDLNFEDILRATEGWSEKYVIGRGKHGTVYRTESLKSRKNWAVKKVDISENKFSTEMRSLSLVRHRNVVKMGGYSIRDGYGFIVTEYMSGGTLYHVLHQMEPRVDLDWDTRHRIAVGIAQGLSYLHHDCVPQIIHRDIKSDNILLDSELEPKIGDFGAAKLDSDRDESQTVSAVIGTLGYIAPENAYSTRLTEKCDVYSYGVILMELLCRKLPVDSSFDEGLDLVSWVRKNLQSYNGCFLCLDEEIQYWDKDDLQEAMEMMDIALKCTETIPDIRPSMRGVVGSLLKLNCRQNLTVRKRDNSSI